MQLAEEIARAGRELTQDPGFRAATRRFLETTRQKVAALQEQWKLLRQLPEVVPVLLTMTMLSKIKEKGLVAQPGVEAGKAAPPAGGEESQGAWPQWTEEEVKNLLDALVGAGVASPKPGTPPSTTPPTSPPSPDVPPETPPK